MSAGVEGNIAVVIGAGLIALTGLIWIDPALSLLIAAVIVIGTWALLRDSVDLVLDAAPRGMDVEAVRAWLLTRPGVTEVHDLHVWAMSTTETAMTAHVTRPENGDGDDFLHAACEGLANKFGIGDMFFTPVAIGWHHSPELHTIAALDVFLPTGAYDAKAGGFAPGGSWPGRGCANGSSAGGGSLCWYPSP